MDTITNTANAVTYLPTPDAGLATFLVVVQWEWERATYIVTARVAAEPGELLEAIKSSQPRDEGSQIVSAFVIV